MSEARIEEIERRIDKQVAGAVALASHPSGAVTLAPKNANEIMEFAKMMAISGPCIRPMFRGNPGACLAIAMQAFAWGASPFAVANKAYLVTSNKTGEETIGYEAQLVHSIVNTRAPLQRRLRAEYTGSGGTRACKVIGYLVGEDEPFEYQSPTVAEIAVKNSPLWTADRDQQLFYYSVRAWARRHVPEILLGIYTPEEARGEIIDVEPQPAPPRPRREDFDRVEAAADEAQDVTDLPEPYQVCDAVGEVREFVSAEAASDACIAELTAAKDQVSVVWDNNAPLIFDLRERGHDGLADALGARYAAALRARYAALSTAPGNEPPETAEAAPAPPGVTQLAGAAADAPSGVPLLLPRKVGRSAHDWTGYCDELIAAAQRLDRRQMQTFRTTHARHFNQLRLAEKATWERLQQALADHERELP